MCLPRTIILQPIHEVVNILKILEFWSEENPLVA